MVTDWGRSFPVFKNDNAPYTSWEHMFFSTLAWKTLTSLIRLYRPISVADCTNTPQSILWFWNEIFSNHIWGSCSDSAYFWPRNLHFVTILKSSTETKLYSDYHSTWGCSVLQNTGQWWLMQWDTHSQHTNPHKELEWPKINPEYPGENSDHC